jgi:tetratricopeptide (TPR) repeat protein
MRAFRPSTSNPVLGDAAGPEALARLRGDVSSAPDGFDRIVAAIAAEDFASAAEASEQALRAKPADGLACYLLAIAREKQGLLMPALEAYEQALARLPDHADIANDLGRLAWRLGIPELAAPLFAHYLAARPGSKEAAANLAGALRDQHRYGEAIEVLKPAVQASPEDPALWNALGEVLSQQGEPRTAATFFDEALRLDAGFTAARLNRSGARLDLGDVSGAVEDVETAQAEAETEADAAAIGYARALTLLCAGRVAEGWAAYEARLSPGFPGSPRFDIAAPRWAGETLAGRSLLVVAEQGLGDEVMFAGPLPELLEALGPQGRLTLAVEPRLVSLFQRSFPNARVGAHSTDRTEAHPVRRAPGLEGTVDVWAPMGALLSAFRASLDVFPARTAWLSPDPARVARWREWLASLPPGPKVGIVWKSLKLGGERRRAFAPFSAWAPVLAAPDAVFVSLQYGDAGAEIETAAEAGVQIRTPPGLDLKDNMEEVAALCAALDLVIGFANATTQIAGAVGAQLWLLAPPATWTSLGADRYPWHAQARVFHAPGFNWDATMASVARTLKGLG